MASSLVIKVQYDGTLRRFNVSIKKNGELDLDMVLLKTKILGLFDFPVDADLKLTYVDEDGDVVTLVDDDDLRIVTWQSLASLRINVELNNGRCVKPHARSSCLNKVQPSHAESAALETKAPAEIPLATNQRAEEHVPPKDGCKKMFSLSTLMQYLIGITAAFGRAPPTAVDGGREAKKTPETAPKLHVPTIKDQLKETFLVFFFSLPLLLAFVCRPFVLLLPLIMTIVVLIIEYHDRRCTNQSVSMR